MTSQALPEKFKKLAPFLSWALATADEREARRWKANREEIRAFYDAMLPRLEEILAEVDAYPLGQLPEEVHKIYYLALSLAEIAPHIELYDGSPGVPYAFEESRFIAVHGAQDTALGLPPNAN